MKGETMERFDYLISWKDMARFIPYLCGYLYAIVGIILIRNIMHELREEARYGPLCFTNSEKEVYGWYSWVIGIFDLILYITVMLMNKWEFIAIWLAFKVASRWEASRLETEYCGEEIKKGMAGRKLSFKLIINNALYNIFTIGNALVLIWAMAAYKIITYSKDEKTYGQSILVAVAVLLFTFVFYLLAGQQTKRLEGIEKDKDSNNSI